jgi:hypothetical protein
VDKIYISKFGAESYQTYEFKNVTRGDRTFDRVAVSLSTIVGQDGGTDQYGSGIAPYESKIIPITFWIDAGDEESMTTERDTVLAMSNWGVQPLFLIPFNKQADRRWCLARCISVSMPDDADSCSYLLQKVIATFQIANPRWESREDLWFLGEAGYQLDSGLYFEGSRYVQALTGTSLDVSISHSGNRKALACISIRSLTATLSGLSVTYLDEFENVLEKWSWSGTLLPKEKLVVDTNKYSVIHHQSTGPISNSWANFTITTGTGFIAIKPGSSTVRIAGTIAGGQLDIDYNDSWG